MKDFWRVENMVRVGPYHISDCPIDADDNDKQPHPYADRKLIYQLHPKVFGQIFKNFVFGFANYMQLSYWFADDFEILDEYNFRINIYYVPDNLVFCGDTQAIMAKRAHKRFRPIKSFKMIDKPHEINRTRAGL